MSRKTLVFTLGRLLLALSLLALGISIYINGHIYYEKYFHAVRKMAFPDSLPSHKVLNLSLNWDQLVLYLIKFDAILFLLSGLFIMTN